MAEGHWLAAIELGSIPNVSTTNCVIDYMTLVHNEFYWVTFVLLDDPDAISIARYNQTTNRWLTIGTDFAFINGQEMRAIAGPIKLQESSL